MLTQRSMSLRIKSPANATKDLRLGNSFQRQSSGHSDHDLQTRAHIAHSLGPKSRKTIERNAGVSNVRFETAHNRAATPRSSAELRVVGERRGRLFKSTKSQN